MRHPSILAALGLILPLAGPAAEVLQVPSEYPTIQAAVNAATDGDEVRVAPGTYTGGSNKNIDFNGKDLRVIGESGPDVTIIDCGGSGRAFHLVSGEPSTASIEGFTLRGGATDDNGGAVACVHASPGLRDCIIEENESGDGGGGVYYLADEPTTIRGCIIRRNFANYGFDNGGRGGGLRLEGPVTVERCTIEANCTAYGAFGAGEGAGVFCQAGVRLVDCLITMNGGPNCEEDYSEGTIVGSDFEMISCRVIGNYVVYAAGVLIGLGPARIERCLIAGNRAVEHGGGILIGYNAGPVEIVESTIAGNQADGLWRHYPGGGLVCYSDDPILLDRTIVWGNCAVYGGDEIFVGRWSTLTATCCDVDSTGILVEGILEWADDCITLDPLFCAPSDCVQAPDPSGDYSLDAASPCLPGHSPCGSLIGVEEQGCGIVPAAPMTWGAVKALFRSAGD